MRGGRKGKPSVHLPIPREVVREKLSAIFIPQSTEHGKGKDVGVGSRLGSALGNLAGRVLPGRKSTPKPYSGNGSGGHTSIRNTRGAATGK